ncbi:HAD family hydrolase [Bifidobacterium xylocopae]|uniref:HAD family hydrolase n=1 Tax=Bifidobacterium xylocopae TaxID=2493119 RepID=A0A366KFC2_9BIFI|nr:HAD family phosphatase [Bifidobacterium xylocopae]RBP99908.1 HAD family hydrolase [Bifidobacterium xylocopae]
MSEQERAAGPLPRAVFWDMDGTLIDSEPYWHASEMELANSHGCRWTEDDGWRCSDTPVVQVASAMRKRGLDLPVERIQAMIEEGVARRERERMPWIPGTVELLEALSRSGVPSVLVTSSPRSIAEAVVAHAPDDVFIGFTCGDDGLPMKPDPAPYLHAARMVGVGPGSMAGCVVLEDSISGLEAAAASGATTLAFTGATPGAIPDGPQFASFDSYAGITPQVLGEYAFRRQAGGQA